MSAKQNNLMPEKQFFTFDEKKPKQIKKARQLKLKEASSKIDYNKYLMLSPKTFSQSPYYVLRIPKDIQPPKEGQRLVLDGDNVIVQTVNTPADIAKGKGGPVARSMQKQGIGWDVNCLPVGHQWLR